MLIDYNQACELTRIRCRNRKSIEGSKIVLIKHSMVIIYKEILIFIFLHEFTVFIFIWFIVFYY